MGGAPSKDPAEEIREAKRSVDKSVREIDRERRKLENEEKRMVAEVKRLAKQGQVRAARVIARDIVANRNHVTKFFNLKASLQTVSMKLMAVKSTTSIVDAMKQAGKAMHRINVQMNLPAMNRIMQEFLRENERIDNMQEVIEDSLSDVFEQDNVGESDQLVDQVLEEIGLDLNSKLADVSTGNSSVLSVSSKASSVEPIRREVPIGEGIGVEPSVGKPSASSSISSSTSYSLSSNPSSSSANAGLDLETRLAMLKR